ncbi:MAG: DoxX family membrane protein [bacterium]|nr:DoxX family membrane protein [bacterium]
MKTTITNFLSGFPVQFIARLLLGGIFIAASIDKITHARAFSDIVYNYQLLPEMFIYVWAITLPWLEFISGILLVTGIYKRAAASMLGGLLVIFIIAISINLIRGIEFDCGCFSTLASESSIEPVTILIRDILLLIPAAILIFFHPRKKSGAFVPVTGKLY